MSGRKLLRRFSSSISDLLSLQKKDFFEDDERTTPLHNAVQMGNIIMVTSFVESKTVWIDDEDSKGKTALHYAMEQCNTDISSILLKGGANVDCVDFDGTSACHIACKEGMIDHFNLLLYYHVDVCAIDKTGRTPFDLACEYGQEKMMERLLNSGVQKSAFFNAGQSHTASALHLASANGHVQIVAKLLENGWDINRVNQFGSALHLAASYGKTQVVRFLLRAGINPELMNSHGQTAIASAKKNSGKNPITYKEIKFLLKNYKTFVNGVAVSEHCGIKADELTFSPGDQIWIIERNQDTLWKGIVFGQKGNSRSGFFNSNTVSIEAPFKLKKKENENSSVSSMSSRLTMPPPNQSIAMNNRNMVKPVPIPVVPSLMHNTSSFHSPSARIDLNRNSSPSFTSFGRAPSGLSDVSSNDSINGNRRFQRNTNLTTFGQDSGAYLHGSRLSGMTGLNGSTSMLPSTSNALSPTLTEFHRTSTGSNSSNGSSGFESLKSSTSTSTSSSFLQNTVASEVSDVNPCRTSMNSTGSGSGSSSIASTSIHGLDDSFHSASTAAQTPTVVNVTQLVNSGVPTPEVLANWLDSIGMSDYLSMFLKQGYDLYSIARCTPEDLLALGIKNPEHRKKLIAEIHNWHVVDYWPNVVPIGGLRDWLQAIALAEYIPVFESQGYCTVQEILNLTWEDFEDIGIKRLGHLKRIGLAIKKIKDNRRNAGNVQNAQSMKSTTNISSPNISNLIDRRSMSSNMSSSSILHDPPPPAPAGNFQPKMNANDRIDYISYSRGNCSNSSGRNAPPPPPVRQPVPLENRRNVRSSYDALFSEDEPIRLNLVSTGKILSDLSKMKQNDRHNMDLNFLELGSECPPPPAPLYFEANPLRLLSLSSSSVINGSGSSVDQMPFANENCGTIKAAKNNYKFDVPSTLPPLISESRETTGRMNTYQEIDDMMKSLVGELDTMIVSSNKQKETANNVEQK